MYCTLTDIQQQLRDEVIIQLTDDEGAGEIGTVRVDSACERAAADVDAYVQMRYPLPLLTVPPILKNLSADIAIYHLFSRRGFDESTADKVVVDRYKSAIKFLEKLAAGEVKFGVETPKAEATVKFQSGDRKFTRNSMEGF